MNVLNILGSIPDVPCETDSGDYMQDGLLYCGKCNTARQIRLNLMGMETVKTCLCKCRSEAYEKECADLREQQERDKLHRLKTTALRDKTYLGWTFDMDDGREPKMQIIRRYVDQWEKISAENIGLLLWGDVGTGKSFAAACVVNELTAMGVACLMTSVGSVEKQLFSCEDKNEFIRDLMKYKLLVLDDLGTERKTEYMQQVVFDIIDARYRSGKPLIVTTNLRPSELKNQSDIASARIYDRVLEMTTSVKFTVKRRGEIHSEKTKTANRTLGLEE